MNGSSVPADDTPVESHADAASPRPLPTDQGPAPAPGLPGTHPDPTVPPFEPRRPRVLLVAPQPFYEDRGTPIAVRQALEALPELGYEVDLVTYPVGRDLPLEGVHWYRLPNPFRISHVPIGLSGRKLLLDAFLPSMIRRRLRAEPPVAIHAVEEAIFPALWFGRRLGIPVIYDMQSSLPEQLAQRRLFRTGPVRRVTESLERRILRQSALVVCWTGLGARVRTLAPETPVWEWGYQGRDSDPRSEADGEALRGRLGLPSEARIILYSGTFEPYQGLPWLLQAIPAVRARIPGALFLMVGGDPERDLPPEEARRARRLEAEGALRILGRQPREAIPAFLAMAEVLVSPRSRGDNAPLKIVEYLRADRPIVATDLPAHRSLLGDGQGLLVAPDGASLADGIVRVLENPELAAALRARTREQVRIDPGWPAFVANLREWYARALGMPETPRPPQPEAPSA